MHGDLYKQAKMQYVYRGDRQTGKDLVDKLCKAVRRPDGKCIRSKKGTMLVEFENGEKHVIVARQLRKIRRECEGRPG